MESINRSKKRGKSPVREPPPAPRAAEPPEPPAFLSEYMDDGQGAVTELDGFELVRYNCCKKGEIEKWRLAPDDMRPS